MAAEDTPEAECIDDGLSVQPSPNPNDQELEKAVDFAKEEYAIAVLRSRSAGFNPPGSLDIIEQKAAETLGRLQGRWSGHLVSTCGKSIQDLVKEVLARANQN